MQFLIRVQQLRPHDVVVAPASNRVVDEELARLLRELKPLTGL
jgi:hypothetical protein